MKVRISNTVSSGRWLSYCTLAIVFVYILAGCNGDSTAPKPSPGQGDFTQSTATTTGTTSETRHPAPTAMPTADPIASSTVTPKSISPSIPSPTAAATSVPTPTSEPIPTAEPTPAPEPTPTVTPAPFAETSAVRGVSGDLWADVIIGQPDFSQITPNQVVPFKVFNPGGVVVDRATDPGRAYVWDAGNSRILGIALAKCYGGPSPCSADIVLGQPSVYDHSACNRDSGLQNFPVRAQAGPDTLCGLPDVSESPWEHPSFVTMAVDRESNLYVPDV